MTILCYSPCIATAANIPGIACRQAMEAYVDREAKLTSFVVRFVYEEQSADSGDPPGHWYSVVRHVQSDTERRFTRWEDVVLFFQQYVDLSKGAKSLS